MMHGQGDWFYGSIPRYKNLNMFEVEYPFLKIELMDYDSICLSCSNTKRNQLLELSLPGTVTFKLNNSAEPALSNDFDLKIKCGLFTDTMIAHFKPLGVNRQVLASHQNKSGVTVYQLPSDSSDEIKRDSFIKCELKSPILALCDSKLILTKYDNLPKLFMDVQSGQVIHKIQSEQSASDCQSQSLVPTFLDSNLVAICNQSSGLVQLFDSRGFQVVSHNCALPEDHSIFWTFNSSFGSHKSGCEIQTQFLAMLSNDGIIKVYDSRKWTIPYVNEVLDIKLTNNFQTQLLFKPFDPRFISITGSNANVYIYQLSPKAERVFVHDGHMQVEGNSDTVTSSHIWVPSNENTIVSTADNGSIQVWQFEDKR